MSLQHLSIPELSQQLLTQFWLNFRGRFLGSSFTDANLHSDIRPSTFVLATSVHIRIISAVWSHFDQTFWTNFFAGFNSFLPNIFWIKFSLDPKLLWTQNFVDSKFLWTQKFVDLKLYQHKKILDQKLFFSPKTFWWRIWTKKISSTKIFFNLIFFSTKKCLDLKFFRTENFWDKIF